MTKRSPFRYFKTGHEIIRRAVKLCIRFPLSLRNLEDLLHHRGIEISHETVRFRGNRFGSVFPAEIRGKRVLYLDPEVAQGAVHLGVTEQELHGSQIASFFWICAALVLRIECVQ